jgi:MbtH protein
LGLPHKTSRIGRGARSGTMANPFDDENGLFVVLVNDEGQYSLWPDFMDIPAGWRDVGPKGNRATCLAWIDETWTDMRPLSLVRQMEEDARTRAVQGVHPSQPKMRTD